MTRNKFLHSLKSLNLSGSCSIPYVGAQKKSEFEFESQI